MIFTYLIQSASSLPSDASALESAISALERNIKALETSSVPLERRLPWFTGIVVIGVAMEIWVILRERRDDMEAWGRGIVRPPERPQITKLLVELASVVLITAGIVGELWIGLSITQINGQLRDKGAELRTKSDLLLGLLTQQTSNANERSSNNEKEAAQLRKDAARLHKEAETEHLARAKIEARVAWRHLNKEQKDEIGLLLKPFFRYQVASIWYNAGDSEASMFAADITEALQAGKISVQPPGSFVRLEEAGKVGGPIKRIKTGVTVQSTNDFSSRLLAETIIKELTKRGFDAERPKDPPFDPNPNPQVWVEVRARPEGPQGEYKLQAEREAEAKNRSKPRTN